MFNTTTICIFTKKSLLVAVRPWYLTENIESLNKIARPGRPVTIPDLLTISQPFPSKNLWRRRRKSIKHNQTLVYGVVKIKEILSMYIGKS